MCQENSPEYHRSPRTLIVNFNSPELNYLASALAQEQCLAAYVRPYINKGRLWERLLAALPLVGPTYRNTFGRRRIHDVKLARLTREAGVLADICAATVRRARGLPSDRRHRWENHLYQLVRTAVAQQAATRADGIDCVVAYEGFALPAFQSIKTLNRGKAILNYPIAHHRQQRKIRQEECEREPTFASTWRGFDGWTAGHEARLDEEIRLADGILVGSSYARDSFVMEGIPSEKLRVVPYGVDLEIFSPPPSFVKRNGFNVVFAGQLTQRKGLSYLLRGYQKFRRQNSQLTLVGSFVGGPEPFVPFSELFRHVPHLTRPELSNTYRYSDVFVFPTLLEGMGLVVLEAMACGLPVIVTANGPGDIVRDGVDGFVIPARDEEAVCDRLDRLYRDPELRAMMGRNASAHARKFSWQAYAEKAVRYISDTVKSPV